MKTTQTNDKAVAAYIARREQARTLAARILEHLSDVPDVAQEDVHWGHVGTMGALANGLTNVVLEFGMACEPCLNLGRVTGPEGWHVSIPVCKGCQERLVRNAKEA